jgi:hypothetical protein
MLKVTDAENTVAVCGELIPISIGQPSPPGCYTYSPAEHRRRAEKLRKSKPNSRAAQLAEAAARAIEPSRRR